jgi:hypothetical protein
MKKLSEETKRKMSEAKKGKKVRPNKNYKKTCESMLKQDGFNRAYKNFWVTRDGKVRRTREWEGEIYYTDLKPSIKPSGYYQVADPSIKGSVDVQVLVALTYIGERPEGKVVDHKNRNRLDNRVENLRYVTREENIKNSDWYDSLKEDK